MYGISFLLRFLMMTSDLMVLYGHELDFQIPMRVLWLCFENANVYDHMALTGTYYWSYGDSELLQSGICANDPSTKIGLPKQLI